MEEYKIIFGRNYVSTNNGSDIQELEVSEILWGSIMHMVGKGSDYAEYYPMLWVYNTNTNEAYMVTNFYYSNNQLYGTYHNIKKELVTVAIYQV